jgi:hypothetical protein
MSNTASSVNERIAVRKVLADCNDLVLLVQSSSSFCSNSLRGM